jgi:hypothetical protein
MPAVELVLRELLRRDLNMLFLAARVGEAKINELDVLVLDRFQYVGGCSHASLLLEWGGAIEFAAPEAACFAADQKAETMP